MSELSKSEDQRITKTKDEQIKQIDISDIKPNPYQPRKTFDENHLNDLADSIKQYGILQPIVLRKTVQGYYIVVGERRFRASKIAGLKYVSAIIKDLTDEDMMELAVIENLQREDLNAIEEAESYQRLMTDLKITQQEVAKRLSKSRPYIANMLRLLHLPKKIADMVKDGRLTSAHGRTLLAIKDEQQMLRLAKRVVKEKWSVRYLENHVNELKNVSSKSETDKVDITKPKFIKQQERQLREQYGAKVDISIKKSVGKISFEFESQDDFVRIIEQLNRKYGK
ncbi:TPA: ParB/RepB/Spo0J family partition protein [Staphylococcus aureus]|uniref:Chromosome partitioning protein ParB n=1 Tax=Staphylococcus aureus TaxID=1280 RepID=A0A0D1HN73_STAAU|nr:MULTISPECIES: ParB/RepB/Spo0J family partition protein [Staphylococcus]ATV03186.1 Putative DNA-binding protein [Staphylococcus aureus O11]MBN4917503.1 ParB/RepB/Spo0J family partition protein [Staphylococcus sp. EG-SA-10]VTS34408.1 ParB family partitioning protein [Staphylococcus hyicus]HDH6295123.1 ParB/RepB/Spo0J family partition protein [Staphylococcus aureus LTCF-1-17]HDK8974678.1 ParB/RepB/Spo0J family partition protein [Staphylococcus aureus USA600-NRS22]HDK9078735.1 ParB/RepB/Spo0J 